MCVGYISWNDTVIINGALGKCVTKPPSAVLNTGLEGLRETTKHLIRIASNTTEMFVRYKSIEFYHYTILLDCRMYVVYPKVSGLSNNEIHAHNNKHSLRNKGLWWQNSLD